MYMIKVFTTHHGYLSMVARLEYIEAGSNFKIGDQLSSSSCSFLSN